MKTRIITAVLIILVVAFPVFYGGIPLEILAFVIVAAGGYEWFRLLPDFKKWIWLPFLVVAAVIAARFIPSAWLFPFIASVVLFLWSIPVFTPYFTVEESNAAIVFFVLFSLVYTSIGYLVLNHLYLITIVFATYGSDTGAYFIGRTFGKHKMNPRVSPKKSWEGFLGGIVAGVALSYGVSLFYSASINPTLNVLLCLLCPIFAELGDLCFSIIKRRYQIKDFSNLLPGHGGVLDRVDSLLINVLLFGILYTIPLI